MIRLRSPRLTIAMLATMLTFFGILVGIGHGAAPAVLLVLAWGDVTVAMLVGLFLFGFGGGNFPARKGRVSIGLGVLLLGYAMVRLVILSECPGLTALSALPFAASAIWLLVEANRRQIGAS